MLAVKPSTRLQEPDFFFNGNNLILFYCFSEIRIVASPTAGIWNHLCPQRQRALEAVEITELEQSVSRVA